jgi:hypothetical protein
MRVGTVIEIWRYPVKSMRGEQLERSPVGERGLPGDRGWALRDDVAGEIRGAKKFPQLLRCAARYLEEPHAGRIPAAEITLPDATRVRSDDPRAATLLTDLVGKPVTLWPLRPADDLAHYRRARPDEPDMLKELRSIFGRLEDEPLPDLSVFPQELFEFTSLPGTYFDALPLHLLTTATLRDLGLLNPSALFDRRRFRPNILIEPEAGTTGQPELDWCGRPLRVGNATVSIEMPVVRCSMTIQAQGDLPQDPSVLRTIVRQSNQNVGVYANTLSPGSVRVGDPVELG